MPNQRGQEPPLHTLELSFYASIMLRTGLRMNLILSLTDFFYSKSTTLTIADLQHEAEQFPVPPRDDMALLDPDASLDV